jgi:transposase
MEKVIIGVDPHKLSATIEVIDQREGLLGSGRFATDKAGFDAMRHYVSRWANREWAVEGSLGVGRPLSQRLLEVGERVVDVPAKLAARAWILDTGHGRKTDANDAHSVAVAAIRARSLRVFVPDPELESLRMLVDHRDQLAASGSPA